MSFSSTSTPSSAPTSNPFLGLLKKTPSSPSRDASASQLPPTARSSIDAKASLFQETIGFSTLPDQIHRKTLKRGFEFTVMVVGKMESSARFWSIFSFRPGEHGLGKSTFINTLFMTELYADRPALARRKFSLPLLLPSIVRSSAEVHPPKTVEIESRTVELEEKGVKLRLTVVDTPGFGDGMNSSEW